MGYGLSPAGFTPKPFSAILLSLQTNVLAKINAELDLSATSPEGQILTIIANELAQPWEALSSAFYSLDRGSAEGFLLDNTGDLVGIPRDGATATQVACTLTIDAAHAPYAPGTLVASVQGSPAFTFQNTQTVGGTGVSINSGVAIGVTFQAQTPGNTPSVNPGTLVNIVTPVTGWTAITNPAQQFILGANEELDSDYSVRQSTEIAQEGTCNASATVAQMLQLLATVYAAASQTATYSVAAYENTGLTPFNFGTVATPFIVPPKSFATVIYDPANLLAALVNGAAATTGTVPATIAAALWLNKPAGIQAYGASSAIVTDPFLGPQALGYTTPTGLPLFITMSVSLQPGAVFATVKPAIWAAFVAAAIAPTPTGGQPPVGQLIPGRSLDQSQLSAVAQGVPGVFGVKSLQFDIVTSPTNTAPLAISPQQVLTIAAGTVATNIVVTQAAYP